MRTLVDLLPPGHLGAETTLWVRYLLAELERFWDEIGQPEYQLGSNLLKQQLKEQGGGPSVP